MPVEFTFDIDGAAPVGGSDNMPIIITTESCPNCRTVNRIRIKDATSTPRLGAPLKFSCVNCKGLVTVGVGAVCFLQDNNPGTNVEVEGTVEDKFGDG